MWTTEYIIAQICIAIAVIFVSISYFIKNKSWILICNLMCNILYAIQYLLLDAYTGLITNAVMACAVIWFFINEKLNRKKDYVSFITAEFTMLICGIIFFSRWVDILSIGAAIMNVYKIWQPSIKIYRWLGLISSIAWIIYNIAFVAIMATIVEGVLLISKAIGVAKLYIDNSRQAKIN